MERFIWLVLVFGLGSVSLYLVYQSYNTWQDNQVITALKTVAKPVTEIGFPAITICGIGLHFKGVEKVLRDNFEAWNKLHNEKNTTEDEKSINDNFALYMQKFFQIHDRNLNIMDILNTMILPETSGANAVRQNQVACFNKDAKEQMKPFELCEGVFRECSVIGKGKNKLGLSCVKLS